jgi:hypothetical protein
MKRRQSFEFDLDERLRTAEALFVFLLRHRISNDKNAAGSLRLLRRFRPLAVYLRLTFLENPANHFRIYKRLGLWHEVAIFVAKVALFFGIAPSHQAGVFLVGDPALILQNLSVRPRPPLLIRRDAFSPYVMKELCTVNFSSGVSA